MHVIQDVKRLTAGELGLVVAWERSHSRRASHWFVLESRERRVLKSLSDLTGTDVYGHGGTVKGVFHQLRNALIRIDSQPSVQDRQFIYDGLRTALPGLVRHTRTRTACEATFE